jgi:vacuolar-type H+-ATPase catalytic subunit A/Vma1
MALKTIKLVQGGGTPSIFETKAKTWGEFKSEISRDYKFPASHTAILGETVAVLINKSLLPDTVISEGTEINTYHIFITPAKSKSGSKDFSETSYKECKSLIKDLRNKSDEAKNFFGDYTHMSTSRLREVLTSWYKKDTKVSKNKKKAKKVKKNKKNFVENVEKILKTKKVSKELIIETNQDVISTLEKIITFLKSSKEKSKVIFTLNEITEKDYKKFEKLSK